MDEEMVDISELKKLKALLEKKGIRHEWMDEPMMGGASIKIPDLEAFRRKKGYSAIQIHGSAGAKLGLIELWGRGMKEPRGFLSAEETMKMLEEKGAKQWG